MRCLILAVFLAIVQTAPPVPRETPNSTSGARKAITEDTSGNKAPTPSPPSIVKPVAPNPEQDTANTPKPENKEQTIRVRELPPVSVSRDWADWVLWVFSGLLAGAGLLGIRLAYKTLKTIEKQTKAAEEAAKAAQDSVDIMKLQAQSAALDARRLNRAYLTVDSWIAKNLPAYPQNPWRVAIQFSIYNPSRTAARIERLDYKVGTQSESLSHGIMLTPQERYEVHVPSMEVGKQDAVFTIRGEITYRDIFRRERHRTFSHSLKWTSNGFTFYQAEAPGMNDEQEWDKDD